MPRRCDPGFACGVVGTADPTSLRARPPSYLIELAVAAGAQAIVTHSIRDVGRGAQRGLSAYEGREHSRDSRLSACSNGKRSTAPVP